MNELLAMCVCFIFGSGTLHLRMYCARFAHFLVSPQDWISTRFRTVVLFRPNEDSEDQLLSEDRSSKFGVTPPFMSDRERPRTKKNLLHETGEERRQRNTEITLSLLLCGCLMVLHQSFRLSQSDSSVP